MHLLAEVTDPWIGFLPEGLQHCYAFVSGLACHFPAPIQGRKHQRHLEYGGETWLS